MRDHACIYFCLRARRLAFSSFYFYFICLIELRIIAGAIGRADDEPPPKRSRTLETDSSPEAAGDDEETTAVLPRALGDVEPVQTSPSSLLEWADGNTKLAEDAEDLLLHSVRLFLYFHSPPLV